MAGSYTPFSQMKAELAKKPGVTSPGGLAATIMRDKYTPGAIKNAQKTGTSLRGKAQVKKPKHSAVVGAMVKKGY